MTDDEPEINVSREACGHPDRPHVVAGPACTACLECGADLSGVLRERMNVVVPAPRPEPTERRTP